jgi:uncharacterized membrane protein
MKRTHAHLLRVFVAGLLAALPLAATVLVLWWAVGLLLQWVGPGSAFGTALGAFGLGVTGSELVGYLIGLGGVLLGIMGLGLLVEFGLERGIARAIDAVLSRIPLVRTIWELAQKLVGLLQQRDDPATRSMVPVWCHFGGRRPPGAPGAAAVLGLLSSAQAVMVDGRRCLPIIVPTSPVPIGGGLLFVPEEWVSPAEVGMEGLTSIYVSLGVTAPQHLPPPPGLSPPDPADVKAPASSAPSDPQAPQSPPASNSA